MTEITIDQVATRLEAVEEKVAEILLQLEKRPNSLSDFHFEFIARFVGGEELIIET
jgi:hypothetical protein